MHSDVHHSVTYNRENRRMVELKMMKVFIVITNDVYGKVALTKAVRANIYCWVKKKRS